MDNTFILKLQETEDEMSFKKRLAKRVCTIFNMFNPYFKLRYTTEDRLKGNMINIERAMNIYHLLNQAILLDIPGDLVELGCYEGITAVLIQKTLDQLKSPKKLHVYDSFEGLPDKSGKDGGTKFEKGLLKTAKEKLIANFKEYKVKLPIIHEGWFTETLPTQLPQQIAFAHLDGDFYSSIKESLFYVYPRLSKGGVVVIDDYCDSQLDIANDILPGVKKACDEFFNDKKEKVHVLIAGSVGHGYFRKE